MSDADWLQSLGRFGERKLIETGLSREKETARRPPRWGTSLKVFLGGIDVDQCGQGDLSLGALALISAGKDYDQ